MVGVGLRTQFAFLLPLGFVDEAGRRQRRGEMRLATARDEIEPLRDQRVAQNDAYLTILVLSRVITRIGDITDVTPEVVENLFAADLAYLQDFYGIANFGDQSQLALDFPDEIDETVFVLDGSPDSEETELEIATEPEPDSDADELALAAAAAGRPRPRTSSIEELPVMAEA